MVELVTLIVFLLFLAALIYGLAGFIAIIIAAGLYLSMYSLTILTMLFLGIFLYFYIKAPTHATYPFYCRKAPKSDIRFRFFVASFFVAIIWIIYGFSTWSGTGEVFDRITKFLVR